MKDEVSLAAGFSVLEMQEMNSTAWAGRLAGEFLRVERLLKRLL